MTDAENSTIDSFDAKVNSFPISVSPSVAVSQSVATIGWNKEEEDKKKKTAVNFMNRNVCVRASWQNQSPKMNESIQKEIMRSWKM